MDITGLGAVAGFAQDIVDKIFPDKVTQAKQREEFLMQAATLDAQAAATQADINKTEASNENLFVSGWRPAIGWCCGAAFAYHLIIQPFIEYVLAIKGINVPLPQFDTTTLNDALMGLLGLGAMRTVEKVQTIKNS